MEIDKEILNNTTNCEKNFDCLTNCKHIYCKVEYALADEVHFVKCLYDEHCTYKMSFGFSYICNCPTRKEIFNKYGI